MRNQMTVLVSMLLGAAFLYVGSQLFSVETGPKNTVIYSLRESSSGGADHLPKVSTDMLKFKNESDNFLSVLRMKYGPIQYSNIKSKDTTLTPEETKNRNKCIASANKDLASSNGRFWSDVQHIRTKNHTFLKREDAVLIEVGGNQGDDAQRFVDLYNPRYIILEPLEEYANVLKKKFIGNPRVTVVNLGLGEKTEVVMVKIDGNNACATSKFAGAGGETPLFIVNATDFLLKLGVGTFDVDLLTLNCEGCEFETLETILSSSLVKHFRNIQFATHSTIPVPKAVERYCTIQELLRRTHRPIYQYKVLWESWRRKDLL